MNKHTILFFILTIGLNSCGNQTQKEFFNRIVYSQYHSNYEGVITDKYIDKYDHGRRIIVIEEKIFGENKKDFSFLSSELFRFIKIGDTIIKKNKSLSINIIRKNIVTNIKLDFREIKGYKKFHSENQYLSQD
jgi:hypothetical protein